MEISRVRNPAISILAPDGPIPPYPQCWGFNFEVIVVGDIDTKGIH